MDKPEDEVGFRLYTLWVCNDTMKKLKHIAVEEDASVAWIVRQLIEDYVDARRLTT